MNSLRLLRLLFAAGSVSAFVLTAQAKIERTVEKTFTVTGVGTLRIETFGGGIRVLPSKDSVVRVTAREKIKADTDAEADELLKKLELTIEQNGNDVRATAKYERQPAGFRFGSWPPVQVEFEVSVPAGFTSDLSTSGGGITVGNLDGKANLRTSGGAIKLAKMGGPVDARTSGGSIDLEEARGAVDLKTSGGNITVGRVAGPADLATSGGNIKVDSVTGALRAHTSGGSVSATIAGPLKDECSLSTSGGSVRVKVAPGAQFKLDAATSSGGVELAGLRFEGESKRGKSVGNVNGGGPLLKLRSSGGSISVRAE